MEENWLHIWQLCRKHLCISSPLLFNTHTFWNTLHWSPHPQLIPLHLNKNKQPGADKPLLFCTNLILLSIIFISSYVWQGPSTSAEMNKTTKSSMAKQPAPSKMDFNPVLVSCVSTQQLRKSRLPGQSKPPSGKTKHIPRCVFLWLERWWCEQRRKNLKIWWKEAERNWSEIDNRTKGNVREEMRRELYIFYCRARSLHLTLNNLHLFNLFNLGYTAGNSMCGLYDENSWTVGYNGCIHALTINKRVKDERKNDGK